VSEEEVVGAAASGVRGVPGSTREDADGGGSVELRGCRAWRCCWGTGKGIGSSQRHGCRSGSGGDGVTSRKGNWSSTKTTWRDV
jgi:hypothetical protein